MFLITSMFLGVSMSAPPGIEIIFIAIVAAFVSFGIAVGVGVAVAIRRVFKIKLSSMGKTAIDP